MKRQQRRRFGMRSSQRVLFACSLVVSLVLTACGPAGPVAEPTAAPAQPTQAPASDPMAMYEPAAVTGDIIAAGSSTVFPLSEAVAELFRDEGYGGNLTIDSIGSGAGLESFCKTGETDIANTSRAIKDSEVESCRAIGREPLAIRVGTEGLAVVVNTQNDFLTEITQEQLAMAFSTAETWADVDAAWPNEPILRFSPGTDSGTFDYFIEVVMDPMYVVDATADAGKGEEALLNASNLQLSEDDNVLVQGVEGSPFAIGYFDYAYYQENADRLTVLAVDGVTPSAETVDSGQYPLARPLFLYTTAEIMQEKPQVAAFVYFYLTRVNEVIDEVGYFPAAQDALDASLQAWRDATGS